jgi:hypothetical protein
MVRITQASCALLLLVSLVGCLANGDAAGGSDDPPGDDRGGDPPLPGGPGPGEGDPRPDPAACLGDGASGGACEVTADCNAPLVCIDQICVGPEDPSHTCDAVESIGCVDPRETCSPSGVCVIVPGACTTSDQCPVGFVCHDGACAPERDGEVCLDPGPGPSLTGTWSMASTLHLRDGLPGVVDGLLTATEVLADLIEGTIDWGLPGWIEAVLNAIIPRIVDAYIPEWAQVIPVALSNVSDVLDDIGVDSTVYLDGSACGRSYRGYQTWDTITLRYRGQVVSRAPADIPEVGAIEPEEFGALYSCGRLYIDRHRIHNSISGLLRYVIDTVIEIATGYPSVEEAIDAAIDCDGIAGSINDAWQDTSGSSIDITQPILTACHGAVASVLDSIQRVVDEATLNLAVLSLQGRVTVGSGRALTDGRWTGSVIGFDFPGEFRADRP